MNQLTEQQKARIVELAREVELRRQYLARESYGDIRLRWRASIAEYSVEAFRIAKEAAQS